MRLLEKGQQSLVVKCVRWTWLWVIGLCFFLKLWYLILLICKLEILRVPWGLEI